jgi:hypothetical protein
MGQPLSPFLSNPDKKTDVSTQGWFNLLQWVQTE